MKMCEQILKKKTAPQYNSLNCKKTKRRPIIAPAIAVRLLKKLDLERTMTELRKPFLKKIRSKK